MSAPTVMRAHAYAPIERIRHELTWLPWHWYDAIAHVPWIVLPDDLSPLFIGLMTEEATTHDGRLYSRCGGWYSPDDVDPRWGCGLHIYLNHSSVGSAVHEAAHALEIAWHAPVDALYRPERALHPYMASNPEEYFACALDAFLWPAQVTTMPNEHDLARHDPDMYAYLNWRAN